MSAVLEVSHLTFRVGGATLTDDVSLSLEPGDRLALSGPNGAGKTTLMHLIAGVHTASEGTVVLDGADITSWSAHRRARAGLARTFQITNLLPSRSVEENLAIAVMSSDRRRAIPWIRWRAMRSTWTKVDELIELSGLGDIRSTPVGALPYGDQRRLEIAVALARPAKVVMLDEPGAGLTADEAGALVELVFGLDDRLAVLFVDHDVELVQRLATRMVLLDLGRVVSSGPPAEVAASDAFRRIYLEGRARA